MLALLQQIGGVNTNPGLDHCAIRHPLVVNSGRRGREAECHVKRHGIQ